MLATHKSTLVTKCGHLNWNDLHRSFRATWHSRSKASAQSKRSNEKASFGWQGVDGQSRALTRVRMRGSQEQYTKLTSCSVPEGNKTPFMYLDTISYLPFTSIQHIVVHRVESQLWGRLTSISLSSITTGLYIPSLWKLINKSSTFQVLSGKYLPNFTSVKNPHLWMDATKTIRTIKCPCCTLDTPVISWSIAENTPLTNWQGVTLHHHITQVCSDSFPSWDIGLLLYLMQARFWCMCITNIMITKQCIRNTSNLLMIMVLVFTHINVTIFTHKTLLAYSASWNTELPSRITTPLCYLKRGQFKLHMPGHH